MHSLLAGRSAKRWARGIFGPSVHRWYRLFFVIFAVVSLTPVVPLLTAMPDWNLYSVPAPWSWIMVAGQLGAAAGMVWTVLRTSPMRFIGIHQLLGRRMEEGQPLQVRGLYGFVRHPLYSLSIVLIWLSPRMSAGLAVLYALMTLYFVLGSIHEEKLLTDEFGDGYRRYRERIPAFIPRIRGPRFRSGGPDV